MACNDSYPTTTARSFPALLLLGTFLSSPALAQQAPTKLDAIVVSSDRSGGTVLDETANISVVTDEDIENRDINDLDDLLRYEPGVTISRQTNATDPFNTIGGITIRGVGGNRVGMQVDGSRVAERITDGTRDYVDLSFTKQAEIVRGPASVLWGADSLGGLLAVESVDPEDILEGRDRGARAGMGFDSLNDRTTAEAIFAQRLAEGLEVMLGYKREESHEVERSRARADGGFYGCPRNIDYGAIACDKLDPTDQSSERLLAKLVWTPNSDHRLEFTADLLRRETDVDQKQSLGPVYSSFTGLPTGEIIHAYDRHLDLTRDRYAVEHSWTPSSGWLDELKTTFAYVPHSYESLSFQNNTSPSGDAIRETNILNYSEEFYELDVQATKRFVTGIIDHELIFGFDGDIAHTDYQRISRERNLTAGTSNESRAGGFNFTSAETRRADLYAQDHMIFGGGAFELTPGVRLATYRIDPKPDADYVVAPGSEPRVREDEEWLLSLGATYHVNDSISIWAKYGEGFKMPTAQQLFQSNPSFGLVPAPGLKPEYVKSYELGLRHEGDSGYTAVNVFRSEYSDFIENFYNIPGTSTYTYRNLNEVEIWGIELSGARDLSPRSWLGYTLAYQEGKQRAMAGGEETPFNLAPLTASVTFGHDLPQHNLSIEAVTTMASEVKKTATETGFKPDGYAILDLYGKWRMRDNAVLNVGVQNVFDTRYFTADAIGRTTTPSTAVAAQSPLELTTGAGRTLQVSLDIEF